MIERSGDRLVRRGHLDGFRRFAGLADAVEK
jgi:hypothetical protein